MWFLIAGHEKDIPKLVASKLIAMEVSISEPRGIRGIAFPENQLSDVLRVLNLPPHISQYATDKKEIVLIEAATAICENSSELHQGDVIQKVFAIYANKWGRNIYYRNAHGRMSEPLYNGQSLYVRFYSVPVSANSGRSKKIPVLFGHKLGGDQSDGFAPNEEGRAEAFLDGETIYAQLVDNTLCILCDLPHRGTDIEPILHRIMQRWEETLFRVLTPEEIEKNHNEEFAAFRQSYADLCAKAHESDLEDLADAIEEAEAEIAQARITMIEAIREKRRSEKLLAELKEGKVDVSAQYVHEYETLATSKKIERVRVIGDVVCVYTTHLVTKPLTRDGTVRDLGKYLIKIDHERGRVQLINMTRMVDGRNHPHVDRDGDICLGNIDSLVSQLIAKYLFAQLVHLMLKFIENPNEQDIAGVTVYSWPIAS